MPSRRRGAARPLLLSHDAGQAGSARPSPGASTRAGRRGAGTAWRDDFGFLRGPPDGPVVGLMVKGLLAFRPRAPGGGRNLGPGALRRARDRPTERQRRPGGAGGPGLLRPAQLAQPPALPRRRRRRGRRGRRALARLPGVRPRHGGLRSRPRAARPRGAPRRLPPPAPLRRDRTAPGLGPVRPGPGRRDARRPSRGAPGPRAGHRARGGRQRRDRRSRAPESCRRSADPAGAPPAGDESRCCAVSGEGRPAWSVPRRSPASRSSAAPGSSPSSTSRHATAVPVRPAPRRQCRYTVSPASQAARIPAGIARM